MWLAAGRLREALRCEQHSEATLEAAVLDHVLGPKIRARQSTRKEQGYNRLSGLDGVRGRARAGSGPSKTPRVGGSNHVEVRDVSVQCETSGGTLHDMAARGHEHAHYVRLR